MSATASSLPKVNDTNYISIQIYTDKKEKKIFLLHKEIQKGSGAKVIYDYSAFPHILGSLSSYMTLHLQDPITPEFPYI
jgi:hypothetical protein